MDGAPRTRRPLAPPAPHLRSSLGLLASHPRREQPLAHIPRDSARARGLLRALRLHARRVSSTKGPPIRTLLGLSGRKLLRAHFALRQSRRLSLSRRPSAPARHWRHHGLGARALPQRRLGSWTFRRLGSLRARRPSS